MNEPALTDAPLPTHPLVSVIIPCFNAERFVADAIKSALHQTYSRVEVVAVDDGSTDRTLDVLRSFGRDISWISGPNRGAPAARNQGIRAARGELLQFLDADDVLLPEKLSNQIPLVVDNSLDSVWCDVDVVPFEGETCVPSHTRWRPLWDDDPVVVALGPNPGTPSPIHTTALVTRIGGFREDLRGAQDRDLHLRAACAGARFGYVPAALAKMRRHSTSLSADFAKVLSEYERVIPCSYDNLIACGQMTEARAVAFAGFMAKAARTCIRFGDHCRAARYLEAARRMHEGRGIAAAYGRLAPVRKLVGPWHTERAALCADVLRRMLP